MPSLIRMARSIRVARFAARTMLPRWRPPSLPLAARTAAATEPADRAEGARSCNPGRLADPDRHCAPLHAATMMVAGERRGGGDAQCRSDDDGAGRDRRA